MKSNKTKQYNKKDWSNQYGTWKNGTWTKHIKTTEPEDNENLKEINICLYDNETIQSMVDKCLPEAGGCEFQIHYHSLQVHMKRNDSKIIITIPLTYYNFDQIVTSGSVEMEMKDVNDISNIAKEEIDNKTDELFKEMPILNHLSSLGFEVEYTVSDNGSIHRHPGDFSFSSIDYDKTPEEPGVIYRQANAKDLYQTDSVIYLSSANGVTPKFVCTETRIVNVKLLDDDNGIEGTYTEIPTMSFILQDETNITDVLRMLGQEDVEIPLMKRFKTTERLVEIKEYPLLTEILKAFVASNFRPSHKNVVADRINKRHNIIKAISTNSKKNHTVRMYGDMDIYDDYSDQWLEEWEKTYYEHLTKPEENTRTITINSVEHYWHEGYYVYLPLKYKKMTEQEIIEYISEKDNQ